MKRIVTGMALLLAATGLAQAAGDPAAGQTLFMSKCALCHKIGPGAMNAIGPVLNGVVGRASASLVDYNYSRAMTNAQLTWDAATLTRYLKAPAQLVPGTKMTMTGLTADKEIADVIAYLASFDADGEKVGK